MTRPKQEMIVQDPPATSSNEAHQGSHAEPEQDPGSHEARFKYLQWQSLYEIEKPFEILIDIPSTASDQRRSNLVFGLSSRKQKIQSVRNRETYFRLDTHGFAFRKHETKFTDWTDRDAVEKTYIPEMELLLKREVKGADRVFTYDWRLRNSKSVFPPVIDLKDPTEALHPATQPHVDCSQDGCVSMIKYHLPNKAQDLLKNRYRIINVWRPLSKVKNWPLALCDSQTVDQKDLITADRVRREFVGEGLWSLENLRNRWYYWPDQEPDEVILLKIAESKHDVGAKRK